MERPISSLAFKGSIVEAITEAKRQKKLFVVYISGDNPESTDLEKSTWTASTVAESLSKYCILLHILEGSTDAAHFSAIYSQKSVPCVTAIGYNGVQLWQNEGFVSAEVLASSLEKAWLSLHVQETTASFLTAALASKKSEQLAFGASGAASFEEGSSSRTDAPSPSTDKHFHTSEARQVVNAEIIEENKGSEHIVEEKSSIVSDEVSPGSVLANELESDEVEQPPSLSETVEESLNPVRVDQNDSGVGPMSFIVEDGCPAPEENSKVVDHHSGVNIKASRVSAPEGSEPVQCNEAETVDVKKADVSDFSTSKSNDVHLNIRLPNGASLQEKFPVKNTLKMIKDYVDENQASSLGSYDLAIPYPRKVFNDQDLSRTLLELGLFNRQALIVVPHHQAVSHHKGGSSSRNQTNSTNDVGSSNGSNEGYFAFMKKILSYVNPFSYLGGGGASSSNSAQQSQSSMWQYSPNPTLQNNLRDTGRPYSVYSSNKNTPATEGNSNKSKQPNSSRFGSNIHTLKHDEDDSRFRDRNAFWNGNSTEYGGDNDGK